LGSNLEKSRENPQVGRGWKAVNSSDAVGKWHHSVLLDYLSVLNYDMKFIF
jgi:hypothetical protein